MDSIVIAAVIAAIPATMAAWSSMKTNRRIKTNHGKSIGQHVEDAADEAKLVREELESYKQEQRQANQILGFALQEHTASDAVNFAYLRAAIERKDK